MRVSFSIVFVSDMGRSVSFYRDTIGLPLKFESPHWSEFGGEETTLALHLGEGSGPADRSGQREAPGSCRPGLSVTNLDEFHKKMLDNGVPCLQEPTEIFGARLAQYEDPDRLTISVGEER